MTSKQVARWGAVVGATAIALGGFCIPGTEIKEAKASGGSPGVVLREVGVELDEFISYQGRNWQGGLDRKPFPQQITRLVLHAEIEGIGCFKDVHTGCAALTIVCLLGQGAGHFTTCAKDKYGEYENLDPWKGKRPRITAVVAPDDRISVVYALDDVTEMVRGVTAIADQDQIGKDLRGIGASIGGAGAGLLVVPATAPVGAVLLIGGVVVFGVGILVSSTSSPPPHCDGTLFSGESALRAWDFRAKELQYALGSTTSHEFLTGGSFRNVKVPNGCGKPESVVRFKFFGDVPSNAAMGVSASATDGTSSASGGIMIDGVPTPTIDVPAARSHLPHEH